MIVLISLDVIGCSESVSLSYFNAPFSIPFLSLDKSRLCSSMYLLYSSSVKSSSNDLKEAMYSCKLSYSGLTTCNGFVMVCFGGWTTSFILGFFFFLPLFFFISSSSDDVVK